MGFDAARRASQSASAALHSWPDANTTLALAGGRSVARAIGSALRRVTPSAPSTSNL